MNSLQLSSVVVIAVIASAVQAREWRDVSGEFSIEAELVDVKKGEAHLKTASGKVISVPVEKLCPADLKFLRDGRVGQLAAWASMMYVRQGSMRNSGEQLASSAPKLAQLEMDEAALAAAKDSLLRVLLQYQDGIDTLSGKQLRPGNAGEVKDAFGAGLTGDEELIDGVIDNIAGRLAQIERHKLIGAKQISDASLQHEQFWRQTMLPLVKEAAGPAQESLGFEVHAVRGPTTGECGIAVKNVSGQRLHNLCLAVNSTIGFPGLKERIHYVAVEALDVNQELMLSWRLVGALVEPGSNPDMGDGITFSAWATEFSNSTRKLTLPKDISVHRKTRQVGKRLEWVSFRLKLAEPM